MLVSRPEETAQTSLERHCSFPSDPLRDASAVAAQTPGASSPSISCAFLQSPTRALYLLHELDSVSRALFLRAPI